MRDCFSGLILGTGIPALTSIRAGFHREACIWCLLECGHSNGVKLEVIEKPSNNSSSYKIVWNESEIDKSALYRAYNKNDGPEHGAVAIALLLIREKTDYTAIRRSFTGTGFDYWLGYKKIHKNQIFKGNARLEVSGSLRKKLLTQRVDQKIEQTERSDDTSFPAYIIVVGFSEPKAEMVLRNVKN